MYISEDNFIKLSIEYLELRYHEAIDSLAIEIITLAIIFILGLIAISLPKKIYHFSKEKRIKSPEKKRAIVYRVMATEKFNVWLLKNLKKIYNDITFVELYGKLYTSTLFLPSKEFKYPFTELCKLKSLNVQNFCINKNQNTYWNFLTGTIHRPDMKGFALKKIFLDKSKKITHLDAIVTNYKQNVLTTHILEWELFQLYNKEFRQSAFQSLLKRLRIITNKEYGAKELLEKLPQRRVYHGTKTSSEAIVEPGNAFPLLSVQAMVIFKDYRFPENVQWKIIIAKRAGNVAIRPNILQFQPAGGFEVYGAESDDEDMLVKQDFDIRKALLREYAEELYDIKEFKHRQDSRDADSIYSEPVITDLLKLIETGKAKIMFLGTVIELAILRHELSFLIVIDDKNYLSHKIKGSSESSNIMALNPKEIKEIIENGTLHSSSAGLLKLALDSSDLKELGILDNLN